ncbi:MAG TPA: hypothetical protein VH986_07850 [Acidimicrobiia bacterium]|jgi:hypothetical protein
MADAIFLLIIVGFFLLCVAYVRGCERIVGPELEHEAETDLVAEGEGVPTPVTPAPVEQTA